MIIVSFVASYLAQLAPLAPCEYTVEVEHANHYQRDQSAYHETEHHHRQDIYHLIGDERIHKQRHKRAARGICAVIAALDILAPRACVLPRGGEMAHQDYYEQRNDIQSDGPARDFTADLKKLKQAYEHEPHYIAVCGEAEYAEKELIGDSLTRPAERAEHYQCAQHGYAEIYERGKERRTGSYLSLLVLLSVIFPL